MSRIVTLNNLSLGTEKEGTLSLEAVAKTFRYLDQDELDAQAKARKAKKKGAKKEGEA
jgi:type IV pilus assembly protein PilO